MEYSNAVIVLANNHQFLPGQTLRFRKVKSRMLLWCKTGRGHVVVNGREFELLPDRFLAIPWQHDIRYEADARRPFLVAGVHLVPDHRTGVPVGFSVPHSPGDPLECSPNRRNAALPGLDEVRTGSFTRVPALGRLAEYCVLMFGAMKGDERLARDCARVLLTTLLHAVRDPGASSQEWPVALQKIIGHIENHLHEPFSLTDACAMSSLSPSAVGRMFIRHRGMTPGRFIAATKMQAAENLLKSTRLPVSEIGARIGMKDICYFSKWFKLHAGISPLKYRSREAII